jgi:hypothetical protein
MSATFVPKKKKEYTSRQYEVNDWIKMREDSTRIYREGLSGIGFCSITTSKAQKIALFGQISSHSVHHWRHPLQWFFGTIVALLLTRDIIRQPQTSIHKPQPSHFSASI